MLSRKSLDCAHSVTLRARLPVDPIPKAAGTVRLLEVECDGDGGFPSDGGSHGKASCGKRTRQLAWPVRCTPIPLTYYLVIVYQ